MPLRKLPKVMWEHTKAGIPDPCIKVRKGSGKELAKMFFDPTSIVDVEIIPLVSKKRKTSSLKKLKKQKRVKVCLW